MRDLGNTLIVVEHDEDTMMAADYLIDIGPGAGIHGGRVISAGTPEEVMNDADSLTGRYLSGAQFIPMPPERRKPDGRYIEIKGASEISEAPLISMYRPSGFLLSGGIGMN